MGKSTKMAVLMAVLFALCIPAAAFAAGGTGDGSGGGKLQPLAITDALPADGATGVELSGQIKLTFSKNVVYMTVRENNLRCFSLWNGEARVPVEVIMADDQVEREKRNDVIIKPLQPLQPGTTYRVEVEPALESKSGVTLGQKTTLSFTTTGVKAGEKADLPVTSPPARADSTPTMSDTREKEEAVVPQTATDAAYSAQAAGGSEAEGGATGLSEVAEPGSGGTLVQQEEQNTAAQEKNRRNRIVIDIIIVIAAGLAAWWFYRKWRHP